jgi:uncharacterized membrane protein YkoI
MNRPFIVRSRETVENGIMRILVAIAAFLTVGALAFGGGSARDHERARRAVETGEILPLSKILAVVEQAFEGRLIEVELEDEDGTLVYEIEILAPQGNVIEVTVDARDAKILEVEGRGIEAARKKR